MILIALMIYRDRLKSLKMNNNKIIQVPKQIGKLALLKELSLSHNQLDLIDGAIGNCIRLRKELDVSHNNLPGCLAACTVYLSHAYFNIDDIITLLSFR